MDRQWWLQKWEWFQLSHGLSLVTSHSSPFSDLATFRCEYNGCILLPDQWRSSLFISSLSPLDIILPPWLETGFLRLIDHPSLFMHMTTMGCTLANTIGALQIGVIFAVFLFGIITLQTHLYFRRFAASDPWKLKVLVGFLRVEIPQSHK